MFRFAWLAQAIASLSRPIAFLLRDLGPWLIRAAIGWLVDRLGGAGDRPPSLCRTCPFQPPRATVPLSPRAHPRPSPKPVAGQSGPALVLLAFLLAVLAVVFGAGCTPAAAYVAADRATFDAVAPEYADYVNADPTLDTTRRTRRLRTIDAWRMRLEKTESGAE